MEITKEMYEKIAHLFPKQKSPPKISNLEALNAILKVLENGSKWRSLGKNWGVFSKHVFVIFSVMY